jgi:uncharacterized DUF497 family protein
MSSDYPKMLYKAGAPESEVDGYVLEWDSTKNASNEKKHGISFDEAKTVFSDDFARLIADPDHSKEEERFILLGSSIESNRLSLHTR